MLAQRYGFYVLAIRIAIEAIACIGGGGGGGGGGDTNLLYFIEKKKQLVIQVSSCIDPATYVDLGVIDRAIRPLMH